MVRSREFGNTLSANLKKSAVFTRPLGPLPLLRIGRGSSFREGVLPLGNFFFLVFVFALSELKQARIAKAEGLRSSRLLRYDTACPAPHTSTLYRFGVVKNLNCIGILSWNSSLSLQSVRQVLFFFAFSYCFVVGPPRGGRPTKQPYQDVALYLDKAAARVTLWTLVQ